jgi:hypothetical protein
VSSEVPGHHQAPSTSWGNSLILFLLNTLRPTRYGLSNNYIRKGPARAPKLISPTMCSHFGQPQPLRRALPPSSSRSPSAELFAEPWQELHGLPSEIEPWKDSLQIPWDKACGQLGSSLRQCKSSGVSCTPSSRRSRLRATGYTWGLASSCGCPTAVGWART